jgi:phosphoribosyl-ATP pyrophosphohydrolase
MAKSGDKRKRAKPAKPNAAKPKATKASRTKPAKLGRIMLAKTLKANRPAKRSKPEKIAKPGKIAKPEKIAKPLKPKQLAKALMTAPPEDRPAPPLSLGPAAMVLDRLWSVVVSRRTAAPAVSHSARLLSRGTAKVAQKFGEEAVECLIEAVAGNHDAVVAESADVLYHLIVLWVSAGVRPDEVWTELKRREGVSGIAEKASRVAQLPVAFGLETTKIP